MEVDEILRELEAVSLSTKSAIYVWGYNQRGQTARKGSEFHLRIPKRLSPELFKYSGARWLDIACGREHTAAVASDGSLFTWGSSFSSLDSVIYILCALIEIKFFSCFLIE